MDKFNCSYDRVKFDEACVNVISDNGNFNKWLYSLSMDCLLCPYKRIAQISNNISLKFSTIETLKWRILNNNGSEKYVSSKITSNIVCELTPHLGQYGLYELAVQNNNCNFKTIKNPTYPYTGIYLNISMASTLFMIFVNDGSGSYTVLEHTIWDGMLLGDIVFPCFMWIMGVCIPIALSAQLKRGVSKLQISYSILKRSFLLFLIGVSLNTLGTDSQVVTNTSPTWIMRKMQDILSLLPHWFVMLILVIVHCALTFCLPVPGCPTGYLGPGGRHEDGKYFNCTGGATGYIDKTVLTLNHIYQYPTIKSVYGSGPFDPEGILGCLTAIFQVFLGVHAGTILMLYKDWKDRVIRWLLWAVFYACLGCAFHFTNTIPVNKNLWHNPINSGMNALLLYVGHSVCYEIFPFHWRIGAMDSRALCLIESIWVVILWAIIAYIMHRKRTYITL
ncbi:HGNAT acetyltransferase, partial [Acromyrmex heyeri]